MHSYNTVTEAIPDLIARGYTRDFNVRPFTECFVCNKTGNTLSPDEFVIDEVFRFEGMTDPADEMILYAISSDQLRTKGILLNGYGMYAEPAITNIIKNLSTLHQA